MREYTISAELKAGGDAIGRVRDSQIAFDATYEGNDALPNPAELLLISLSACMLKNVERYSKILHLSYRKASVKIKGYRSDRPPVIFKIEYVLEIDTDEEDRKLDLWHRNILKFGTITNTLMRAAELTGELKRWENE